MYCTRREVSWQLFSDSLVIVKWMNEFVHFFIMKNAGYKHHITLLQGSLQKKKT